MSMFRREGLLPSPATAKPTTAESSPRPHPAPHLEPESATVLAEDTEFIGTLRCQAKTVTIGGRFEGEVHSDGHVIVGPTGEVKADLRAGSVCIHGKVAGNVYADGVVSLRDGAELYGDIISTVVKIEEGVIFVGHCEVSPLTGNPAEQPTTLPIAPAAGEGS